MVFFTAHHFSTETAIFLFVDHPEDPATLGSIHPGDPKHFIPRLRTGQQTYGDKRHVEYFGQVPQTLTRRLAFHRRGGNRQLETPAVNAQYLVSPGARLHPDANGYAFRRIVENQFIHIQS